MPTKPLGAGEPAYKREVEYTNQFKRDYKREKKGRHRATIVPDLLATMALLADDIALPAHMVDHALSGNWKDHRDCHLKPDLVLIYRKIDQAGGSTTDAPESPILQLVRLGSHSELGF